MNMLVVSNVVEPIFIKEPIEINLNLNDKSGRISPVTITDGTFNLISTETIFGPGTLKTVVDLD